MLQLISRNVRCSPIYIYIYSVGAQQTIMTNMISIDIMNIDIHQYSIFLSRYLQWGTIQPYTNLHDLWSIGIAAVMVTCSNYVVFCRLAVWPIRFERHDATGLYITESLHAEVHRIRKTRKTTATPRLCPTSVTWQPMIDRLQAHLHHLHQLRRQYGNFADVKILHYGLESDTRSSISLSIVVTTDS